MPVGLLTIDIELPGCTSLKQKRSRLKPLLARLHREFNLSAAELDYLDVWQSARIACAVVSNDERHNQRVLQETVEWISRNWPDVEIMGEKYESR